jgi:outer membrane protein TolC
VHEHPDLAVYVPMTQQAQAEVHEAEADKHPDWGVELNYGRRGPAFSDMISLQVSLSLPVFQQSRQDPRVAAKRQELHRIEEQREAMLRDHTSELDRELSQYEALTKQLARARDIRIPLAREKVALQLAGYEAGKSDLMNVLSARRELIEERTREIALDSQRAQIAAKLYFVYGEGAQ